MKLSELKALVDAQVAYQAKFGNDPEVWYFDPVTERASRVTAVEVMEGRTMESQFVDMQFVSESGDALEEDKLPYANHPLFLITNKDPGYLN